MKDKLEGIGDNLFPAIAYGDSLGLPVETKTRDYIQENYGQIRALHTIDNPFLGRAEAGTWSDDTQLSLAVAEALIEAEGFSMPHIVDHHIKAYDEAPKRNKRGEYIPLGWGASTFRSVTRLKYETHTYENSGSRRGQGNGVLMKLAPLALWQAVIKPEHRNDQISDFARMTHNNDLSVLTAMVHRDILKLLLTDKIGEEEVIPAAYYRARQYDYQFDAGEITSKLLGQLDVDGQPSTNQILELASEGGFRSPETLVMAYGAFARSPHYPESVYEAVNLGGDADSIASIVGAMSILHNPDVKQPHDIEKVNDGDRLHNTGRELVKLVLK